MAQSNGIPPFNDEFSIFFRFQASPPTVTLQQPASESSKNPAPKKEETKKEETKKAKPALKEEDKKSKPDEGKKESKPTSKAEKPPPSEENLKLHAQLLKVGEECLESSELLQLVQFRNGQIRFYDGFEPSGRMHIAQGVFKSLNVNTCTQAGVFVFWVADFFALMNDKMGGDLSKIKIVGEYLVEVWKAAGMDLSKVEILWASDEIVKNSEAYMAQVCDIARRFTLARLVKCCQIMGRNDENSLTAAQILYPLMQCADVFFLKADVCQLGLDQRKVNMLARDYAQVAGRRFKPVILSHHMVFGLKEGHVKMSKSDPDSAIFMEDSKSEVERKVKSAYCPTSGPELDLNPCLDYVRTICFHERNPLPFAGGKFKSADEVKNALVAGELLPDDLKTALADHLNQLLEPVRTKFSEEGSRPKELLELIQMFKAEDLKEKQQKEELDIPEEVEIARRRKQDKPAIRRVVPSRLGGVAASSVVFLPAPRMHHGIVLEDVLSVVVRLTRAVAMKGKEDGPVVLFVSDWSMICQNCLADREEKASKKNVEGDYFNTSPSPELRAYVDLFLAAVQALIAPAVRESFLVMKQSELMKEDPLNYLLSIINVGRSFKLSHVCSLVFKEGESEPATGPIISSLLTVADVLALGPPARILFETEAEGNVITLVQSFFDTEFASRYDCGGPAPLKLAVSLPDLRLLRTEEAASNVENVVFVLDDGIKKKVKNAFCEEGNVHFNPLLSGFVALWECEELKHLFSNVFQIKRSPENGGDVSFTKAREVFDAFAAKQLHPGDFKTAVQNEIVNKVGVDPLKNFAKTLAEPIKVLEACKKRNPERIVE